MVKRLWPALSLAGALLLAAASLQADEISNRVVAKSSRIGSPAHIAPRPAPPPIMTPAIPGDDDMPNRYGRPAGGDYQPFSTISNGEIATSGKLFNVLVLVRQRGLAYFVLFR